MFALWKKTHKAVRAAIRAERALNAKIVKHKKAPVTTKLPHGSFVVTVYDYKNHTAFTNNPFNE